jgi:Protein of unknown function (DUF2934)
MGRGPIVNQKSGVNHTMAKEPGTTDKATPKKRTVKAKVEGENGTKVAKATKTASPSAKTAEVVTRPNLEEKIRVRAYELYLQRQGQGGSPEQDWLQAVAEVHTQAGA